MTDAAITDKNKVLSLAVKQSGAKMFQVTFSSRKGQGRQCMNGGQR